MLEYDFGIRGEGSSLVFFFSIYRAQITNGKDWSRYKSQRSRPLCFPRLAHTLPYINSLPCIMLEYIPDKEGRSVAP